MPGIGVTTSPAVDPVLTGLFSELMNEDGSRVGRMAAPLRVVNGVSAQYAKLSGSHRLNLDQTDDPAAGDRLTELGLNAESRETGVEFQIQSVDLERYADHIFVDDRTRRHWDASHGFDVYRPAIARLQNLAADRHNYKVLADVYSTSGNFSTTSDPGDLDTTSTALFAAIEDGVEQIIADTGFMPTHIVMNSGVARHVRRLDDSKEAAHPGQGGGGVLPTLSAVANIMQSYFNLTALIDFSFYETSAGAADAMMGDHIAIVRLANDGTPTFAQTFVEPGLDTPSIASLYEVRTEDPRGAKIVCDSLFKVKVVDSTAGYLLTDVLT